MDGGGALGHVFQNALSRERDVGKAVITLRILAEEDNYQWWPKSAIYTYITYVVMETTTHTQKKKTAVFSKPLYKFQTIT